MPAKAQRGDVLYAVEFIAQQERFALLEKNGDRRSGRGKPLAQPRDEQLMVRAFCGAFAVKDADDRLFIVILRENGGGASAALAPSKVMPAIRRATCSGSSACNSPRPEISQEAELAIASNKRPLTQRSLQVGAHARQHHPACSA
ncbi:MAG: hypothetical protein WKF84_26115 [Pyrinomonadaceae bacterium]